MKLKRLFQYGFIAACLLGNAMAMDDKNSNEALLIVGCRPWDNNIQEISGLEMAHFVDFMAIGAPTPMPSNFHHVDLNDAGVGSAGKFTDFAASRSGKFKTIIIDWMTYHHIGERGVHTAWKGFADLLIPGGKLIVPVTKSNNSGPISKQTAQEIVDSKLTDLFGAVEILSHDTLPTDTCFDLLRRNGGGITECALSFTPAIIIATKGLVAGKEAFNPPVSGEEVSEKIEEKISIESETKDGDEPSPIATSTEITIENKEVINEATDEPSPIAAISDIPMEKEGALNEAVLALSPKAASKEAPIPDGYKAVKFPSLNKIKEGLRQGRSTIYSETHDGFYVQSIMGTFFGFSPEAQAKDFDLKMKWMGTSQYLQGSYGLFGIFSVMFADSNSIGIPISLKSDTQESPYIVEGGTQKEGNLYLVSDPEELQIITPIKKRQAGKTPLKAPMVDEKTGPAISSKPTIIHSARYCPNLYRKMKNNAEAIQKIHDDESHNLQGLSRDLLLGIRRELREAEDIIATIEDPLTTAHDRALVATFSSDREDGMPKIHVCREEGPGTIRLAAKDWL